MVSGFPDLGYILENISKGCRTTTTYLIFKRLDDLERAHRDLSKTTEKHWSKINREKVMIFFR